MTQKVMLKAIHRLLDEADAVVTYNGDKFDLPTLNGEFVQLGLHPPAPAKSVDLIKIVKSKFRFPSNKLEYVAPALGVGNKLKNSGHELWVKCMAGDKEAWKEMEEYNIQDTVLLEKLFSVLLPWTKLPSLTLGLVCRSCSSSNVQRRGYHYTAVSKFQRYQCKDCGAWGRSGTNEITVAERKNLLRPL